MTTTDLSLPAIELTRPSFASSSSSLISKYICYRFSPSLPRIECAREIVDFLEAAAAGALVVALALTL